MYVCMIILIVQIIIQILMKTAQFANIIPAKRFAKYANYIVPNPGTLWHGIVIALYHINVVINR